MTDTRTYKLANTGLFEDLAYDADKRQRNRRVTQALLDALDPNGYHVVTLATMHNDVEVRTQWLVKLAGQDEPATVWLDMSFDNYHALPEITTEDGQVVEPQKEGK